MSIMYNVLLVALVVLTFCWLGGFALFCWVFWQYRKAEQEFLEMHHDYILPKQEADHDDKS